MPGSVTLLIHRAKAGDHSAADDLLSICIPRLIEIARKFQIAQHSTAKGGSDFAMLASAKFWQGLVEGRLQTLSSRENLWPLLLRMTMQEAKNHARSELTQKRGAGNQVLASEIPPSSLGSARPTKNARVHEVRREQQLDDIQSPSNETVQELERVSAVAEFLEALPFDLREVAVLRLLGYRNSEIAACRNCAERSVERKLKLIRDYLLD